MVVKKVEMMENESESILVAELVEQKVVSKVEWKVESWDIPQTVAMKGISAVAARVEQKAVSMGKMRVE